jgi:hypothetical protein
MMQLGARSKAVDPQSCSPHADRVNPRTTDALISVF